LAEIRPFHGVHYDPAEVGDLSEVICPPHDIITPQMQIDLYRRSEYNFVRVELGRELPGDREGDNRYTRAAAAVENWLGRGVLKVDTKPSLYIDEHSFTYKGRSRRRRGINCLVRLEEWERGVVRPHEGTFAGPKNDRLNLIKTLRANTSPIMVLYEDRGRQISGLLDKEMRRRPALGAGEVEGESHRLWAVTGEAAMNKISRALTDQPLYIADGHHRYESALAYRRARRAVAASAGEEPFDFVMMTLVAFADPGLVILPAHRLVRGVAAARIGGLLEGLKTCFTVEQVPANGDIPAQIEVILAEKKDEVRLAMYGPGAALHALTLHDCSTVAAMIPYFHTGLYGKLDVSIVDHVIVGGLLGLADDAAAASLDYVNDAAEAVRSVDGGEHQLAFIVNPVDPGMVKAIADSGDRMPRKSTYFYPKIPAGLVFYRFD
jgi:uncharacterized protein (DUF1015 family)